MRAIPSRCGAKTAFPTVLPRRGPPLSARLGTRTVHCLRNRTRSRRNAYRRFLSGRNALHIPYANQLNPELRPPARAVWMRSVVSKAIADDRNIGLGPNHHWSSHGDGFGRICNHYDQPDGAPPRERYSGRRSSSRGAGHLAKRVNRCRCPQDPKRTSREGKSALPASANCRLKSFLCWCDLATSPNSRFIMFCSGNFTLYGRAGELATKK